MQNCIACYSDAYYWDGYCITECPIETYVDISLMSCEACKHPCVTCISATKCLSCALGYYLYPNGTSCVDYSRCPQGTFPDASSRMCKECHSSCMSCIGGNVDDCTSCNTTANYLELTSPPGICTPLSCSEGSYLNETASRCIPCDSKCKGCDGPEYCLACKPGHLLISLNGTNKVQCQKCPLGYELSKANECVGN